MPTANELNVIVSANTNDFEAKMNKASKTLQSFGTSSSKVSTKMIAFGSTLGHIAGNVISRAFSAMASSVGDAIKRFDTMNNFSTVMSGLGVSADISSIAIDKLSEKLKGLPTKLDTAAAATQRLTAINGNLQASTDMFLAMNNAILAGTNDAQMQASALEQMMQAYAKGKPDMQDWKILLQAMPSQLKQIAQSMGYVSSNDLYEALKADKVSMNDFMFTIMKLNKEGLPGFENFETQARNNCAGVATGITNMKTAITRGITNIINVLSSSNIPKFFENITNAINTAMNYIAAFVKLIKEAVAWIGTLFGGKGSTNNLVKETDAAVDNMAGIASGAEDVADGIDDANKAAKKLKQQLAGFDEMNVLHENTSSGSSGATSGAGGAGAAIANYNWDNEDFGASKAADKIEEIFQRMMNKLKNIFDFDVIKDSIIQFIDDIKAAAKPIGEIIGDIWNEYLKPLVSWAGNSLLPGILDAIGGAIQLVGAVLREYWNSFLKPFIDDFLVPIAQWTGGIIVSVLHRIGEECRKMANNESAVRGLASALAAISAVITTIKISKLATDITKATGSFKKAWDAGLTLASAFGHVSNESSGIISVVTGGLSSALSSITGVIGTVKGAFSGLFGLISAHPIGALIAVIGALMLTNDDLREGLMDLLKAVLSPIMSIIKSVADAISPLISIIASSLTPVLDIIMGILQPIASIIGTIFKLISPFVEAVMKISTALSPVNIALKVLGGLLELLKPLFEAISGFCNIFKDGLSALGGAISNAIGGFFDMKASQKDVDKMNGKLKESSEKYTKALQEQEEIIKRQADSLRSLDEAEKKLEETDKALLEAEKASGSQLHLNAEEVQNLVGQLAEKGSKEERLQAVAETYGLSLDKNREQVTKLYDAILDENSAYNDLNDKQQEQEKNLKTLAESQNVTKESLDEGIQSIKDAKLNSEQLNSKLEELANDGSDYSKQLRDAIIKDAGDFGMKWNETTGKMERDSGGLWGKVKDVWCGIGEKFGNWFNDAKQKVGDAFNKIGEKGKEIWGGIKDTFNSVGNWFGEKFKGAKEAIGSAWSGVKNWAKDRWNDIKGAFGGAVDTFKNIGSNIWNGLKEGIGNIGKKMGDIFSGAVNGIKNFLGIHSPSRLFAEIGGYMAQGLNNGFSEGGDDLIDTVEDITACAKASLKDIVSPDLSSIAETISNTKGKVDVSISDAIEANSQTHVTVKVGEDTIIDKVIDGINEKGFLSNQSAIIV
ncbi:MAG: tape measure protein [Candidatus Saccharibacteria bacterium]|nr:tape measure protein [Candidatus Saccharibacteria bacterium]